METILSQQTQIFLYAVILGILLGVVYDLLRVVHTASGRGRIVRGVLDVLFCAVCLVCIVAFLLFFAGGQMRVYISLGLAAGAILYGLGLSDLVCTLCYPLLKGVMWVASQMVTLAQTLLRAIQQGYAYIQGLPGFRRLRNKQPGRRNGARKHRPIRRRPSSK